MHTFNADMKIGDIVAQRGSLSRVFEKYRIDYCCGGKATLAEAATKRNINPQIVLNELHQQMKATDHEKNWTEASLSSLIDHIQSTYHDYLKEELPQLVKLVKKVATVHGDKHPELLKILDTFIVLKEELEAHMKKEDDIVFPAIKELDKGNINKVQLKQLMIELEQEHDEAGAALHKIREQTNQFIPPENACNSYCAMFSRLAELESAMHKHVHLENSILFPKAIRAGN